MDNKSIQTPIISYRKHKKFDTKMYSYIIKSIIGLLEAFMAIPILGWLLTFLTGLPFFTMLFLHTVSLVVAITTKTKLSGNIVGIFSSLLSIFPIIGWIMHVITAFLLIREVIQYRKLSVQSSQVVKNN